jgi:hypothetical protein
MNKISSRRVSRLALAAAACLFVSTPAAAQYGARPITSGAAVGDRYHIEASAGWWNPEPEAVISSESLGIPGDEIDLTADLGIEQKRIPDLRVTLRPGTKHKFRFNYLPLKYSAESVVQREFVFNGQRFRLGLPVNTTADLTTFRIGYEYDFFYRDRGFVGVLLDVKYTNVDVQLDSPIGSEFTSQVAPIPTIGIVGRGYIVPNVSISGEVSFFSVPDNLAEQIEADGRYLDYDFYGTFNFNRYVGAQVGVRSIDVSYVKDLDSGTLNFTGLYFGAVVRY